MDVAGHSVRSLHACTVRGQIECAIDLSRIYFIGGMWVLEIWTSLGQFVIS